MRCVIRGGGVPVSYQIDAERRLVIARGHGVLTYDDIATYQAEVWSRAEVAGFDEIVDNSAVDRIAFRSSHYVAELAGIGANMDCARGALLAIVAPDDASYGLARMYQTYRELEPKNKKKVNVVRSFADAWQWITDERRAVCRPGSAAEKPVS
jgi:hypothetical protein